VAESRESASSRDIYQLKVTLKGARPPIWRRFQVKGGARLDKLHLFLQVIMGWSNYHLYQFTIDGVAYGEPHPDYEDDMEDAAKVRLSDLAPGEGFKFDYMYDFGDSWEHRILVEKILPPQEGVHYPVCLAGKRACPPEDCGGVWGYEELLETIRDPEHEQYDEMMDWLGGEFNPEAFDLNEVNERLSGRLEDAL